MLNTIIIIIMFLIMIFSSQTTKNANSENNIANPTNQTNIQDKVYTDSFLKEHNLIDVKKFIPSIEIDMRYATTNNFTKQQIYKTDETILQSSTAQKLKKAQELFQKDGYSIKIYDAFRPKSYQIILYNAVENKKFVANPDGKGSNHSRGAAVDMTLVDKDGNEILMPSHFDDFTGKGARDYEGINKEARKNILYMETIMKQAGFKGISHEWWHYDDVDYNKYPIIDIN